MQEIKLIFSFLSFEGKVIDGMLVMRKIEVCASVSFVFIVCVLFFACLFSVFYVLFWYVLYVRVCVVMFCVV